MPTSSTEVTLAITPRTTYPTKISPTKIMAHSLQTHHQRTLPIFLQIHEMLSGCRKMLRGVTAPSMGIVLQHLTPLERISTVLQTTTTEEPESLFKQIIQAPGNWILLNSLFLLCINGYWGYKIVWFPTEVFILQVLATNIGILYPMIAIKRHSSEDDLAMWLTYKIFWFGAFLGHAGICMDEHLQE